MKPVVLELVPPPDPWEAFCRLERLPHVLFLDSALQQPTLGRYSFLTADPFEFLGLSGPADPLVELGKQLARWRCETVPGLPPFQGGAAGLFSYDLCHYIEKLPRPRMNEFPVPDLAVGLYDWVLAFDHVADRAWLISTGFPHGRADQRIRQIEFVLATLVARKHKDSPRRAIEENQLASRFSVATMAHLEGLFSNFDRPGYLETIRRAIEYIHAGDCFQVNIAQRLLYPQRLSNVELYHRLRERNPATFAGYFDLGDYVIASASPERFLRVERGEVETRPIKGTRPRGATPEEDDVRANDLLRSGKDRAENVMIVDLLRNDLGRVCQYGSVRVADLCRVESYPFVHHLVSEVRGRLRPDAGPLDLLRAAFPGGSVTGAPKVRAMEIIAELEPNSRGAYCGSLGYIGFDGTMDTNLLIRTITAGYGWLQFPVGGGIVADSIPEREYEETWHKAEGLLRALREADAL